MSFSSSTTCKEIIHLCPVWLRKPRIAHLFIEVANVHFKVPQCWLVGEGEVNIKINFNENIFVGIVCSVNLDHLQLAE